MRGLLIKNLQLNLIVPLALTASTLLLSACAGKERHHFPPHQFWQRTHAASALYMRGPKAEQILKRDIQNCVHELQELERLTAVHNPLNVTYNGRLMPIDPLNIEVHEGEAMLSGNTNYINFDGCMYSKGWERANHFYSGNGISASDLPPRRKIQQNSRLLDGSKTSGTRTQPPNRFMQPPKSIIQPPRDEYN